MIDTRYEFRGLLRLGQAALLNSIHDSLKEYIRKPTTKRHNDHNDGITTGREYLLGAREDWAIAFPTMDYDAMIEILQQAWEPRAHKTRKMLRGRFATFGRKTRDVEQPV